MAGRLLPGTALRVRRGRRQDLAALRAVLPAAAGTRLERTLRRLLGDLRTDVYVAVDGEGTVVGVVAVTYVRSLFTGGLAAVLDGARTRPPASGDCLAALIAFAEGRARRRGCRRLTAPVAADDAALRAALVARGYRTGESLALEIPAP